MSKGQWIVAGLAATFILIILNSVSWNIERAIRGGCTVTQQENLLSPGGRYEILSSIVECSDESRQVWLQVKDPNSKSTYSTILRAPSSYSNVNGITMDPVALAFSWGGEAELEVRVPEGLMVYVGEDKLAPLSTINFGPDTFYGLEVNFHEYSL